MENAFIELTTDEMTSIDGGSGWTWVLKLIEAAGICDAIIEFAEGFGSGYESGNGYGN